jgi:hypothetical protein
MPNISISGLCHPVTMFSVNRPPVMWSIVVHCFAAMMGWMVGTCEVANTLEYFVDAPIPAAQENASNPGPLKLVTPPNPSPSPHGHEGLKFHLIGHPGESKRARPIGPALRG